ncbi:glycosyltransferase family 2 protein [Cellulomonas sp. ACRRI]|uniref:glycosyltransferase family 2 protein n=1 Tax=Cellulomonas sp. ACRRI TaxID=2918188 RepID=UPI001EF18B21|nr:glycosyltransferase family A protein [Cellulomonas sp. ACRRI]MCG7287475.1 glycosyltransferase family 2 protein [Cellulomonas sp. ACRRI]
MSGLRDGVARPAGVELTVVIAAFDAEATLGEQLDALAAQCAPFGWELVVADNGSTDGTADLARSYADRLPVRVVDASATRGAGAARNVGVSVARAPLVAFCDADDVVGDGWLVAMRTALRTHAFVAGRFDAQRLNTPRVLRSRTVPQTAGLQESTRLPGLHAAGAGNMGIRADLFRAVGGFDPGCLFLEDTDLCWRVQLAGVPLTWVPEAVLHVRLRGSVWSSAQQGYHYGTGERWLALRYREQEDRLRALAAAGAAAGVPAGVPAAADQGGAGRAAGSLAGAAFAGAAVGIAMADPALAGGLVPAGQLAAGAALTGAGLTGAGLAATGGGPHRPGAARAARRLAATGGDLLRVRSLGDLGRWSWDVGWGVGYAFGRVDPPAPVRAPGVASAPGAAAPGAAAPAAPRAGTPVPAPAPSVVPGPAAATARRQGAA